MAPRIVTLKGFPRLSQAFILWGLASRALQVKRARRALGRCAAAAEVLRCLALAPYVHQHWYLAQ